MKKLTHDVIVLGGGSGGLTAAAGLTQLGLKTLLVERERLGGDCLFYGCVPSKTLIKSARVYNLARRSETFGLPKLSVPSPDAAEVMGHVQNVIEKIIPHDSPERFRGMGADVRFGSPRFLSPYEIRLNEETVSAPHIVIATGSESTVPPIPGLAEAGFITHKEVFELKKFPARLATIGGGPIGVELSQALARFGVKVTILEAAPRILLKEDDDVVNIVVDALRRDGVDIRIGVKITSVENSNGVRRLLLADGEVLEADEILVATGRRGSVDGLELQEAGVETDHGFIKTDTHLATTRKNILGIGDVNGKFLFTHVAGTEGRLAVRKIAMRLPVTMDYNRVPWCTYTDPEIASIGYNEARAKEAGIRYTLAEAPISENDRALAEAETDGKMKILLDSRGRLIGTQIVGTHAGDLWGPALYAFKNRSSMSDLMAPIFPYPTMSEMYRKVSGNYLSPKLFNSRVRTILRLLFGYRGIR